MTRLVRIGIALLAFLAGAAVGVVTTFTHRQLPPWGLILGVILIATLLVGLRLAFDDRLPAMGAALGVLVAIGLLSLQPASGSALVANDALGIAWAIIPTAIAVIVALWPRPRPRPEAPRDAE